METFQPSLSVLVVGQSDQLQATVEHKRLLKASHLILAKVVRRGVLSPSLECLHTDNKLALLATDRHAWAAAAWASLLRQSCLQLELLCSKRKSALVQQPDTQAVAAEAAA